jgi:3-isopropylmalate dehydrogenase
MQKTIAVLPGDFIGPEVVAEAVRVLQAVAARFGHRFDFREAAVSGAAYDKFGKHLPEETLAVCRESDAILKGPFGGPPAELNHPKWAKVEQEAVLGLRKAFQFYINLRPVRPVEGLLHLSPVREEFLRGVDILFVRELASGMYFGPRGRQEENGEEVAWDTELYRAGEIERIALAAFGMAMGRRKKVTLVAKSNVLTSSVLWREVVARVAREYPDVTLDYQHVDAATMYLISNPRQYDVVLTSNMFGDILTDEASVLTGSLGLLGSASLAAGTFGLYEPVHGSAPDIAGQEKANPIGMILSSALMLRHSFGLNQEADAVEAAVYRVLAAGYRTPDLAASEPGAARVGTRQMGDLIARSVRDSA